MSHRILKGKLLASHFIFSLFLNTSQPLLPVFQEKLGLSIFQSSAIPTTMTISVMLTNLMVGFLIARIGQKTAFVLSIIIAILGTVLMYFASGFVLLIIGVALMGMAVGIGFTSLATMYAGLPLEMQNFGVYHAFFGIGGIIAPLFISLWLRWDIPYNSLYLVYAGLLLVLLIFSVLSKSMVNMKYSEFKFGEMFRVVRSPIVAVSLLTLGAYAAAEIGTSNYGSNMTIAGYGLIKADASLLLSAFWLLFTFSRVITDPLARKFGPIRLIVGSSIFGLTVLILWIIGVSPFLLPLLGLAYGPVFPVFQKYMNNHLPEHQRGLFNGLTYAATGIITTIFLPIMGSLGDITMGLAFIPTAVLIIVFTSSGLYVKRHMN